MGGGDRGGGKVYANASQKKARETMLISKYISEQKLLPVIKRSFYDYKRESINQDNIILNVRWIIIKLENT